MFINPAIGTDPCVHVDSIAPILMGDDFDSTVFSHAHPNAELLS